MKERAVAMIQARLGSGRLPGKVLLPLAGTPVILHITERLRRVVGLDGIVVTTTSSPGDDELARLLGAHGIAVYRHPGDENDLLGRYLAAGRAHGAEIALVVCGDCPLFDPDTASRMIAQLRRASDAEYVQIQPPTIEGGVACLRHSTFARIEREGARGPFREHATLRILEQPHDFRITTITPDPDFADLGRGHRFWLDTPADYEFLRAIYDRLARPGEIIDLRRVLELLDRDPGLRRINGHVRQKNPHAASPLVAIVQTHEHGLAGFFSALERYLVEFCHVGVRTISRGDAGREASRLGAALLVTAPSDHLEAGARLPVVAVSPDGDVASAAEAIRAKLVEAR